MQVRKGQKIKISGGFDMKGMMIGSIVLLVILWTIHIQRRLVTMDEHVNDAMNQIGVQLSSKFDALMALLDLAKGYSDCELLTTIETVKSCRSMITAKSTPDDVWKQEGIISVALSKVIMTAEKYPKLKNDKSFEKYLGAVDSYEKMIRTSCLIYNDSVTKLNRELRMFPTSLVGRLLGFRQHDYLESARGRPEVIKQPI